MRERRRHLPRTLDDETALPTGIVLKPPFSVDDLKKDTENDPEAAEEFVSLIRALRKDPRRQ